MFGFLCSENYGGTWLMTQLVLTIDDDVAEATAAMAATYETAARGVLYEHRPQSLFHRGRICLCRRRSGRKPAAANLRTGD